MTLQWTFVATVLYVEIFLIIVLLLPFISPKTWQKLFRCRLATMLSSYSAIYFYIFIAILVLLFAESVREAWKYSKPLEHDDLRQFPEAENAYNMKLFRAQRNMYIAGMALFLWFILKRLITLIATEATLMAQCEASMKQAESASAAAKHFMEEKNTREENKKNLATEEKDLSAVEKELASTRTDLETTREELYRARVDLNTIKKQAESTNQEYDRLLKENAELHDKLEGGDNKKEK
ncbi:B-cell receptor-associated protein 31-like isoform X1 [Physella acuta]|uniref:B-cell receptor-associated protein 31-like isoform X1 n=1 Tax=Physella acuta TaxID=109671 RepID=UPI0027DC46B0|nr:B-cell receptor-associated protein 31-like isoform X1 [Physella acuta]XP_059165507.1 B-cell receptor-associated protein 31-like isoform X1 [Physella acuta]XP_059165508.1 B-cell receptor-associated protein 31-like isoform X1 [Physella acuta]